MEYVTQIHTGADGTVQMNVPDEWADRDVTVVLKSDITPTPESGPRVLGFDDGKVYFASNFEDPLPEDILAAFEGIDLPIAE